MSFITGDSKHSWQPIMTADTATRSYWINWRFLLCAIWVLIFASVASFIIWKYERTRKSKDEESESKQKSAGILYADDVWRPCLRHLHPAWLLAFRLFAFCVTLTLIIIVGFVDGGGIFYFYTQWTFILVTIYFGLGSLLSINGCYQYHKRVGVNRIENESADGENESYLGSSGPGNSMRSFELKILASRSREENHPRQTAGFWGYVFQIIYQMNAGAVMLTDCVFWFIMVPFLLIKDYNLNFLVINMHSINAVFLLGDTVLNSLRFPWFRIAYFFLWTSTYVIVQWIVHACISLWWPYPFLDISSPLAPLWYWSVAVMHIPCFGLFALITKLKHFLLRSWFPDSFQCET